MNTFVILIVLVVAVALVLLKIKQPPADGVLEFAKRDALFTPAERSFLGVLEQSLDGRYRVFGKVRLGDIVKPAKGLSNSRRTTGNNKINQKHVDFVVCSASTLTVVGVVELDDKSHERDDRSIRDQFVDRVLADAKIPVIHFSAKKGYALAEVKAKLAECLAIGTASSAPPVIHDALVPKKPASLTKEAAVLVTEEQRLPVTPVKSILEATAPVCPKCESTMVKLDPMLVSFFGLARPFPSAGRLWRLGRSE